MPSSRAMSRGGDDTGGDDKGGSVQPRPAQPRAGDERLDRLAEGLQICRAMFTEAAPSFEGRYYRIERADNRPRPVRAGGVPILVDGEGDDRVLGLAARYGDAVSLRGDVETVRRALAALDRHCDEAGRDRAAVSRIGVATMVIAPTGDEATDRVQRLSGPGQRRPAYRSPTVAGTPDAVAEQVAALRKAGVDGVVLTLADAHELGLIELTGARLRRLFA